MGKTIGEKEALKDMMGGKRAEIDTERKGERVTETATQQETTWHSQRAAY